MATTYPRVTLVGESGTGKSLFVHLSLFGEESPYQGNSTLGIDVQILIGNDGQKYAIRDTGGRYRGCDPSYWLLDADLVVRFERSDSSRGHEIYEQELRQVNRMRSQMVPKPVAIPYIVVQDFKATTAGMRRVLRRIEENLAA